MKRMVTLILAVLLSVGGLVMGDNAALTEAKRAKKDEFYTQRVDIENELRHYKAHFEGKVVLCNCDDPRQSEFFKYFAENFEKLKLKRLIAVCYKSQDVDLFSQGDCERAIKQVYEGDKNGNMVVDDDEVGVFVLNGDGDFRSAECIEILKEADIVVTNPPFSLFREYMAQLMKYGKKFLILGNKNALTYADIFPLIKENRLWIGVTPMSREIYFKVPQTYIDDALSKKKDRTIVRRDGQYVARSPSIWFTNLDHRKRHENLPLYKRYTPDEYPKFDNYDAINVNITSDIPYDYNGVMGVPITFMDKYNPDQFEILGMCENEDLYGLKTRVYNREECQRAYFAKFGKKGTYDLNASGVLTIKGIQEKVYQRILIRRRGQ